MIKHTLKASARQAVGRAAKRLHTTGQLPANVFGKDVTSTTIQVGEKELAHLLKEAGESTLIYLQVEGEKDDRPVMMAELKRHPVTGMTQHVAFHQVNLKQKVTTTVPVKLVGEAPAVTEKLGILVQQLSEIEIEALPTDVPEHLEVDITSLAEVDAAVLVRDIKVPADIEVKTEADSLVAKIEPLAAEEPKEAPAPVEGEAGVAEGETTAEGEVKEGEEKKAEVKAEEVVKE